jgi:hypothetical protein
MILNASYVCLQIQILEDRSLISELVLSHVASTILEDLLDRCLFNEFCYSIFRISEKYLEEHKIFFNLSC